MMHLFIDERKTAEICEHIKIRGLDLVENLPNVDAFLKSKFVIECEACGDKHRAKLYSHKKRSS